MLPVLLQTRSWPAVPSLPTQSPLRTVPSSVENLRGGCCLSRTSAGSGLLRHQALWSVLFRMEAASGRLCVPPSHFGACWEQSVLARRRGCAEESALCLHAHCPLLHGLLHPPPVRATCQGRPVAPVTKCPLVALSTSQLPSLSPCYPHFTENQRKSLFKVSPHSVAGQAVLRGDRPGLVHRSFRSWVCSGVGGACRCGGKVGSTLW